MHDESDIDIGRFPERRRGRPRKGAGIYVPDRHEKAEAPDRIEALELANERAQQRARAATVHQPVGARYYPPETVEYEVVPLPGSSSFLGGSSLGGPYVDNH